MTPSSFDKWIRFGRRGTRAVYHVGNLHYDREQSASVDRIADLALRGQEGGRLTLVQRRIKEGVCAYEARRR